MRIILMNNTNTKIRNLAILFEKGDFKTGERLAQEILISTPDEPYANHFMGLVACEKNDFKTAIAYMNRSISKLPEKADFYSNLGEVYRKHKKTRRAIQHLKKALEINPKLANAHLNLSLAYQSINNIQLAIEICYQCLAYHPNHIGALSHLSLLLQYKGRYNDAICVCEKIIQLNLWDANAWNSLGVAYHKKGEYSLAGQCFEKALRIKPNFALAHENRAVLWLLYKDYTKGFLEYQWFRKKQFVKTLSLNDRIEGKRIFIYSERGFGDIIQFSRYIPLLKEQKASVIFMIPDDLMRLFSDSQIADHYILNDQKELPVYDYSAGILFLPCYCKTTAQTIPSQIPYLSAPKTIKRILREEIQHNKKQFNVGFVWAGNPQNENDLHRSIPLSCFETIARLPGIRLFSFQKDSCHFNQLKNLPDDIAIVSLGALFEDFADTASAIQSMDLMICVETAVAHLAGAMGHPTWLLLSSVPDWRWLLDGQKSPWYPSIKIFRSNHADNWNELMAQVKNALLPVMTKTMTQRGLNALKNEQYSHAYDCFEPITRINPEAFHAWFNMGNACGFQKHYNHSIACYEKAVAIDPNHAVCQYNLGRSWYSQRNYQKAISYFQKAIELDPSYFNAIYNLGSTHYRIRNLERSIECFKQAMALKPDKTDIYTNLGACYGKKGDLSTAIMWHQKSLDVSPDDADGHYNMGISLLLDGRLQEGFQEYEWRLRRSDFPKPGYDTPMWDGSKFRNKTILVYMEQGFGDAIQFVRYLPQVKSRGGTVILVCHPFIQRLFTTARGADQVIPENQPLPAFDYHVSLMSLPAIFQTGPDTIPSETPYLSIPLEAPESLDNIIDKYQQLFKIGFVWAGNPANKHDRDRSIPMHMFSCLSNVKGIKMFSLQKNYQAAPSHWFDFIDLSPYIHDFSDTAYAISKLDLIVSVDTAVAHLAGAIHHPIWVLLPKVPDWRWLLDRADSPWYPTIRLFRQKDFGNWSDVFTDIIRALYCRLNYSETFEIAEVMPSTYVAEQLLKQGNHFFQKNQFEAAIQKYKESLAVQPDNIDVLYNLGVSCLYIDQADMAIGYFKQVVSLAPDHEQALNNLGIAYQKLGKIELSISSFEAALKCQPDSARALYNLGNACKKNHLFDKASHYYLKALSIQPDFAECMNNLADIYIDLARYEDALKVIDQAIEQGANNPESYFNKGIILSRLGEHESAIPFLQKAIDMRKDFIDAHYSMSFCLLILGKLEAGFQLHEWRIAKHPEQHNYGLQRWKGEPFENKRLLVYCEQGFGDCIHFARYLPQIKKLGGTVVLGCRSELFPLFCHLEGVDEVVDDGNQFQPCDLQVSIVSLPFLCKTTLDSIPSKIPYFNVPEMSHDKIDPVIQRNKYKYRIGLVWAGNPTPDPDRSIAYETFAPLSRFDKVQVFSFQKRLDMSHACDKMNWIDLSPYLNHFLDTAHAAKQMDLIITIDTSMAHLAGALALPVWVLLLPIPDWRWLLEREDSPWYPTMRLFRRNKEESWENVVSRIIDLLLQNNIS